MRSQWICGDTMGHLLAGLMPSNRLALEMSLRYGMRIGDVLSLKVEQVSRGVFTYKEQKTGKSRRIKLSPAVQKMLLAQAGRMYIFEHRTDWKKHRTRQAVFKDLKRIATAFRLEHVSPHTARKCYAVDRYKSGGNLRQVQKLLNHSSEAVTMLYAMADCMNEKKGAKK